MSGKQKEMALSPGQVLNHPRVRRIPRLDMIKLKCRIGTWNVRTLHEAGKLDNAIKEMLRLDIDILGIAETRWPESGICQKDDATLYYSGITTNDPHHRHGVGILIRNSLKNSVRNIINYSERIIVIQLAAKPHNINIVQIYAPTADKPDQEIEIFYEQLHEILTSLKSQEIVIVLGDFNAKVGRGEAIDGVMGQYGLGVRNERGERLIEFCKEENLTIKNTYYDLHPRRLYTWKSPQDNPLKVVRNQIDYFLIKRRFQNNITRVAAYPGADIRSDHNPIIGDFKYKGKIIKERRNDRRYNIRTLKEPDKRDNLMEILKESFETNIPSDDQTVEDCWKSIETIIKGATEKVVGYDKQKARKPWMTKEILNRMEDRRLAKTENNNIKYNQIHKDIRNKIRQAKEQWLTEQCHEAERLHEIHDSFNFHRKFKDITSCYNKRNVSAIRHNNKIITDSEQLRLTWENYIKELFQNVRPATPTLTQHEHITGPPILVSEVEYAVANLKDGKTPSEDMIHAEVLKLMDPKILCRLFNKIYDSGIIPTGWLRSTFIAIPKKNNAHNCGDHRLISLMSHALKAFLRILHSRIYRKCEEHSGNTQFGFKSAMGTREAMYCIQLLTQKCYDQRKDVYIVFIDYQKAFDCIKHEHMLEVLQQIGLDTKDLRIIQNLYWNQTAVLRINNFLDTHELEITNGVRQGCILSPLLFNVYTEMIFQKALDSQQEGIKINGVPLNNIRYADDTAILANDLEGLQRILNKVNTIGKEHGLKINTEKTKFMIISRKHHNQAQIRIDDKPIERVNKFKYLGCNMNDKLDSDMEIKIRTAMARAAFIKFQRYLCRREVSLDIRLRMIKCYIWPIITYGAETWSLKIKSMNRIEAFEMWTLRRLLRIPWVDRVTNEEVLRRAGVGRELLKTIKQRKVSYLGHILRGNKYDILRLILMGKIEGRRGPGRKQHSWLRDIRNWCGVRNVGDIFALAAEGQLRIIE